MPEAIIDPAPPTIHLYFVLGKNERREEDASLEMKAAFREAANWGVNSEWISEHDLSKHLSFGSGLVFVFPIFEGDVFETFISCHRNCRVIGPQCLLSCFLNQIPIPNTPNPVYFVSMEGLSVCFSNTTPEEKKVLGKSIGHMGGTFSSDLRKSTTHLAVGSALSEKYFKAYEIGIPVLTLGWITSVWQRSKNVHFSAADPQILAEFKCPIFHNLVVTASHLSEVDKKALEEKINSNGGKFFCEISQSTNILITEKNDGEMFKYAQRWNVKCIHPEWVAKCIETGHAVRYERYLIKQGKEKYSTPVKSCVSRNFLDTNVDISVIQSLNPRTIVADSPAKYRECLSSYMNQKTLQSFKTPIKGSTLNPLDCTYREVLEGISLSEVKNSGSLLDGCKIFLMGFRNNEEEKLRRIINYGGAMRLTELHDSVTHIIVGKITKAELENLQNLTYKPHIITVKWLADSIKKSNLEREHNYSCLEVDYSKPAATANNLSQPSPLSKKGLQMLNPVEVTKIDTLKGNINEHLLEEYVHQVPVEDRTQPPEPSNDDTIPNKDQGTSCASKSSLQTINSGRLLFSDLEVSLSRNNFDPVPNLYAINLKEKISSDNLCFYLNTGMRLRYLPHFPLKKSKNNPEDIFRAIKCVCSIWGLRFCIIGHTSVVTENIQKAIINFGGSVVPINNHSVIDYTIAPVLNVKKLPSKNEIVTSIWIEESLRNNEVVSVKYYHRPIQVPSLAGPDLFQDCVITFSAYDQPIKQYLEEIATWLGAKCQDVLSRKINEENNIVKTTHLVCSSNKGAKVTAAKKWNLPIVREQWLLDSFEQRKMLPIDNYLMNPLIGEHNRR